jgi:CheY-like chemotaxis protein
MTKILVVDDDPDIALATRMTLEGAGYTVVEARSSIEGLKMVKSEKPDLVVLDVMMETNTAGFQAALTLRSKDPSSEYAEFKDTPIIMLTAIHETTEMQFGADDEYLPVDVFLDKPIDPPVFLAKVRELLGETEGA